MGVLQRIFGEYLIFRIYSRDLSTDADAPEVDLRCSEIKQEEDVENPSYRNGYGGYQSIGFRFVENGVELARCWFWYADRYKERNFWPLEEHEAKLVRIETQPEVRGKGIAPKLIAYASAQMAKHGFRRLYARIWHSYRPSLNAFQKAEWEPFALVIVFSVLGRQYRFVWRYAKK